MYYDELAEDMKNYFDRLHNGQMTKKEAQKIIHWLANRPEIKFRPVSNDPYKRQADAEYNTISLNTYLAYVKMFNKEFGYRFCGESP